MTRAPILVLSLIAASCLAPGDGVEGGGNGIITPETFRPYPDRLPACDGATRPCAQRLSTLDPLNVDISSGAARDQGAIASCASHGFIGMLENQLHVTRGVTIDLSERYQLYANFMSSGNLGTDPLVIARFPEIVAEYGLMPEAAYPYAALAANASRFHQDLAQGLGESGGPTVDDAIKDTAQNSRERHTVLTGADYLGPLPELGGRPIQLPVQAELESWATVPEIEILDAAGHADLVSCFAENPTPKVAVTPQDFLALCFDHVPAQYFACQGGDPPAVQPAEGEDDCAAFRRLADGWKAGFAEKLPVLQNVLTALDLGQASLVGVQTPLEMQNKAGAVWTARGNLFSGGHAVTIVGYLTAAELQDPDEQSRGMLEVRPNGEPAAFDARAAAIDPEHLARVATARAQTDPSLVPAALRDARAASQLGQVVASEGGILLFRNSWGTSFNGHPIGVAGFQSMTFDFFLVADALVTSRSVGPLDGSACEPPEGLERTDQYFTAFADRSTDLSFRAAAAQVLGGMAAAGAPTGDLQALSQQLAACR